MISFSAQKARVRACQPCRVCVGLDAQEDASLRLPRTSNCASVPGIHAKESPMKFLRNLYVTLFGHYAAARQVKGGSGHYNEQCHPGTYN